MLVFFKQRLVLLAMPKTGSTAYEAALAPLADMVISDPPTLKHAPLYRYNRFIRPMYEKVCNAEMEVAAVMREPVSWLGSWYRYRARPALAGQKNSTAQISFDQFVEGYCQGKRPAFAQVGDQEKFLAPQPNGCKVDHLFAYEDQSTLQAFLAARLGPLPELARQNVSPAMSLELSVAVEAKLRRKFASTFALYDSISGARGSV